MDKSNPLSAPMIGWTKTVDDPYRSCEEEEYYDKTHYLTAVGALLYFSNFTRPDISLVTSVLTKHSQRPSVRHWKGVKHLLC